MPGVVPERQLPLDPAAVFSPLAEYGTVGLAVSGGADSLALMLLAHKYVVTADQPIRFLVYSVDHGLRPEAAAEVAFVVAEARKLGFEARPLHWTGRKPTSGVQQAARRARYRLIADAMAADKCPVLATAHHLHDQAETVLMRLAHGSGPEGLRGMDYMTQVEGVRLVRPLLGVAPEALRAVVDYAGLTPIADPSNTNTEYERVRWRAILPALAELGLDPARLAQFAARMRDADCALETMAVKAYELVDCGDDPPGAKLERSTLLSLPRAVAVRVVGYMLDRVGNGRKPHALGAVEKLTDALRPGPVRTTLHGCLIWSDEMVVIVRPEPLVGARARSRGEPVA